MLDPCCPSVITPCLWNGMRSSQLVSVLPTCNVPNTAQAHKSPVRWKMAIMAIHVHLLFLSCVKEDTGAETGGRCHEDTEINPNSNWERAGEMWLCGSGMCCGYKLKHFLQVLWNMGSILLAC